MRTRREARWLPSGWRAPPLRSHPGWQCRVLTRCLPSHPRAIPRDVHGERDLSAMFRHPGPSSRPPSPTIGCERWKGRGRRRARPLTVRSRGQPGGVSRLLLRGVRPLRGGRVQDGRGGPPSRGRLFRGAVRQPGGDSRHARGVPLRGDDVRRFLSTWRSSLAKFGIRVLPGASSIVGENYRQMAAVLRTNRGS